MVSGEAVGEPRPWKVYSSVPEVVLVKVPIGVVAPSVSAVSFSSKLSWIHGVVLRRS